MDSIKVATFDGPGSNPVIRTVDRPVIPDKAALMKIAACGVCGTDLHILKGHWPKPLPWPFTLGHEVAGIVVEKGPGFTHDYMGDPIEIGCKIMIPPFMPCGKCYYCVHYPEKANKCLTPVYYGRLPGLRQGAASLGRLGRSDLSRSRYAARDQGLRLPDDLPLMIGTLAEPLTSSVRAFKRAQEIGSFRVGDTVVIQGSGPIGVLAIVSAREMGAGRVIVVGAPEEPRLALCRQFGAEATVNIEELTTPEARIAATRDIVGGFGADLVVDCSGHPSAGPEGIEMLRDGGTYIEMGQFTDAGSIETNWHRFCVKDINILGSWAFTADDIALGIAMLDRARDRYPFGDMQTKYPFSEEGIAAAISDANAMKCVKATIVPDESIAYVGA